MKYGRYEIDHELGKGGMARVYLARDPVLNREVAVKVIHQGMVLDSNHLSRFEAEAKTAAGLKSSHIIEIYDYGVQKNQPYIVMEYVSGYSALDIVNAKKVQFLPPEVCASLICQAAEGLRVSESKQIVHRDIKPENLLINSEGVLKIADFGIARLGVAGSQTQMGTILGSPFYMAPEQFNAIAPTVQTDMWALGVNLYYYLTRQLPFTGEEITHILRQVCMEEHEPVLARNPNADPELASITDILMNKDPADRGGGPKWLLQTLKQYLSQKDIYDPQECVRVHMLQMGFIARLQIQEKLRKKNPSRFAQKKNEISSADISEGPTPGGRPGSSSMIQNTRSTLFWIKDSMKSWVKKIAGSGARLQEAPQGQTVVRELSLLQGNITVHCGQSRQLSFKVNPHDAVGALEWTTLNSNVALVYNASVFGVKAGTTRVKVQSLTKPRKSAWCEVEVLPPLPEKIEFKPSTLTLNVGSSKKLEPVFMPAHALTELQYQVDNPQVVDVQKGRVRALKPGKTYLHGVCPANPKIKASLYLIIKG